LEIISIISAQSFSYLSVNRRISGFWHFLTNSAQNPRLFDSLLNKPESLRQFCNGNSVLSQSKHNSSEVLQSCERFVIAINCTARILIHPTLADENHCQKFEIPDKKRDPYSS